jgi:catechol 2,3-dioxygenase-like lactoylglutathione lyase family enzyme
METQEQAVAAQPSSSWLRGVNHVGVTVVNLDDALAFYRDVFGLEPALVTEAGGPPIAEMFQVPGADFKVAFLPIGNTVWELVQYKTPGAKTKPRHDEIGGMHACLEVSNMDEALQALEEHGGDVPDAPLDIPEGPMTGARIAYVRDPNGVQLELLQPAPN